MVEAAIQLDLRPEYQAQEMMLEEKETIEQENIRLLKENAKLQQENARLQQEVNDMRRDYVNLERRHTRAFYRIHELRAREYSSAGFGELIMFIGVLAAVFLFFYYGAGFLEFSMPTNVE